MGVLTLPEIKEHLNITVSTFDAELTSFGTRAEAAVASRCGPLASTPVTTKLRGFSPVLRPQVTPILSLTSITPTGGSALTLSLFVTPEVGLRGPQVVEWLAPGGIFNAAWYDVVYNAGRSTLPEDLRLAALEGVRYFWQTQLGEAPASLPVVGDPHERAAVLGEVIEGSVFPWPRVQHLIEPYEQVWL
jgi:hypothetical protein